MSPGKNPMAQTRRKIHQVVVKSSPNIETNTFRVSYFTIIMVRLRMIKIGKFMNL